jgi:hypothetical protein
MSSRGAMVAETRETTELSRHQKDLARRRNAQPIASWDILVPPPFPAESQRTPLATPLGRSVKDRERDRPPETAAQHSPAPARHPSLRAMRP